MKPRSWFLVASVATCTSAMVLGACANDGNASLADPPLAEQSIPGSDGGLDAGPDVVDAAPCIDCDFFPDTCSPDDFCSNGPFDPSTVGGPLDLRTQVNVVRGRSLDDVWVAGAVGALAHFDGTSWARLPSGTKESMQTIWLRDSEEIAFGSFDVLYSRGGAVPDAGTSAGGWTPRAISSFPPGWSSSSTRLVTAWGPPDAEWFWTATQSRIWRLRVAPSGNYELAVGTTTDLCTAFSACQLTSFHGSSANDLWGVGLRGTTIRITNAQGGSPEAKVFNSRTSNSLHGVWEASANDAWSVGGAGTIRHYVGDALVWEIVSDVPTTETLNAIWGTSSSDIWVVGNNAVILHYDGKGWSRVKIAGLGARRPDLTTVWAPAPGHVWVGGQGVVLSLGGKP